MSELAQNAGITTGVRGAIKVNREMMTNIPDIFAAGGCVETWHRVTRQNSYLPLGTTAHKQGRIAGENAAGGQRQFAGSLDTQIVKVFDLVVARTGLLDSEEGNYTLDNENSRRHYVEQMIYRVISVGGLHRGFGHSFFARRL